MPQVRARVLCLAPRASRLRAFTYAEMIVVLTVILLLSSVMLPKFDSMKRSRELRTFKIDVRNLAIEARTKAVETGDTVALGYDKAAKELFALEEGRDGNSRQLGKVALPEDVSTSQFAADQREAQNDGWRVPFFPDGTSAGGGIEFKYKEETFSFSVQRGSGRPTVTTGELPDMSLEEWKAGGYEPR